MHARWWFMRRLKFQSALWLNHGKLSLPDIPVLEFSAGKQTCVLNFSCANIYFSQFFSNIASIFGEAEAKQTKKDFNFPEKLRWVHFGKCLLKRGGDLLILSFPTENSFLICKYHPHRWSPILFQYLIMVCEFSSHFRRSGCGWRCKNSKHARRWWILARSERHRLEIQLPVEGESHSRLCSGLHVHDDNDSARGRRYPASVSSLLKRETQLHSFEWLIEFMKVDLSLGWSDTKLYIVIRNLLQFFVRFSRRQWKIALILISKVAPALH